MACKKDEVTVLTPAEQAKVDDDQIIEYMKTYKFVDFYVGQTLRNIDWELKPILEDDPESTQSLFDIMGENFISTTHNGVDYKIYYYVVRGVEGLGVTPTETDNVIVDYNVFNLYSEDRFDPPTYIYKTFNFNLPGLIPGWKISIEKFKTGMKTSDFPTDDSSPTDSDYRKNIDTPGRGILLIPSGLAYGSGVLRFDLVLYDNEE